MTIQKQTASNIFIVIGLSMLIVFVSEVIWANVSPGGFEYNLVARWPPAVILILGLAHLIAVALLWIGIRFRSRVITK
jgi:hypothetical protein